MIYALFLIIASVVSFLSLQGAGPAVVLGLSGKLPTLLAVLIAAVFVRLARGLPTLPYDKIESSQADRAIASFRALVASYVQTFIVFVTAIIFNLFYGDVIASCEAHWYGRVATFAVSFVDVLVLTSIYFLVKSDVALAYVQADLMGGVTRKTALVDAEKAVQSVRDAFRK